MTALSLSVLPETFVVCRLNPATAIPAWAFVGDFVSITRTLDELSIVCRHVPDDVADITVERDWRCLKVARPLDFALVGILASLSSALAQAGVSLFAVSTYNTDYLLVKDSDFDQAIHALSEAGHEILAI